MTTYIKGVPALALILASGLALAGSVAATPAFADYGAPAPVYNDFSQVCTSRYDPNCIVKETNAAISTAAPYQQYQAPTTNYNYGNSYNSNYSQPNRYVPNYSYSYYTPSYTPSYNYSTYNYTPYSYSYNDSYNYQYQYQWSYNATPSYSYNDYSYPTYSYYGY